MLERRGFVGGAAITEELHPGFSFTTFSYALSLLRPGDHPGARAGQARLPAAADADALRADGGRRLPPADRGRAVQRPGDRAGTASGTSTATTAGSHDLEKVIQLAKPLFNAAPPDIFSDDPADQADVAWMVKQLRGADRKTLHDLIRFLTGSCADLLDDYFESDIIKASIASSGIIGNKVGPMSQGSGLVLLFHLMGEQDGHHGAWGFHKGGNGGFTQVLQRAAESFGATVRLEAPVDHVITKDGQGDRRRADRRHGVLRADRGQRARPAAYLHRAGRPARAAERPQRGDRPLPLPGHLGEGELRPRRPPGLPGAQGPDRPLRRLRQHRAVDGVPRARLRRRQVRLVLPARPTSTARSSRWSTPTWRRRAST